MAKFKVETMVPMSELRDRFAMAAPPIGHDQFIDSPIMDWYEAAANHAYKFADAMLKAREIKNDVSK